MGGSRGETRVNEISMPAISADMSSLVASRAANDPIHRADCVLSLPTLHEVCKGFLVLALEVFNLLGVRLFDL